MREPTSTHRVPRDDLHGSSRSDCTDTAAGQGAAASARAAARPGAPRRSRRGPVLLVVAVLIASAVGVGAWWFGYARYTTTRA